ncbi:hypothetical protein [Burkholderia sp. Bp9031]|uniref:hypothetical protein n=1 Tax=Burkholderia sp. Bp9031 TaxID=2184566 RepID=UPI00163B45E6|nr:hypothetical protein [Burkholderia sp. Bp9031]
MIQCTLFHEKLDNLSSKFKPGEPIAIVIADAKKLEAAMKETDAYYYNPAKVDRRAALLKKGQFEIPLVVPHEDRKMEWIEGFHQVNAALEAGYPRIPVSTSIGLANLLREQVGEDENGCPQDDFCFSNLNAILHA